MKLPAMLSTTASSFDGARASRRATEARLEKLAAHRAAAVSGDAEIDVVRKIDTEIAAAHGEITAYGERITALEARLAEEEQKDRERRQKEAVEHFGGKLAPIASAAQEIEDAAEKFAAAVVKYGRAAKEAAANWPIGVPAWNSDHLAGGRMGELIERAFSPGAIWRRKGSDILPPPSGYEWAERAATAASRVMGFAQGERDHHAALMEDLRAQPVPEPAPALDDDEQAQAAA